MKCILVLATLGAASLSHAALLGSAAVTPTNLGGGQWSYTIGASNTGDTTIGTLWFGWIPGQNYMGSAPSNVVGPTGWNFLVTHGGATDGWGIRWTASAPEFRIAASSSLSGFTFQSAESPAALAANSPFYPNTPTTTSFFYVGGAFGDPGLQFVATVVPAPTSAAMLGMSALVLGRRRRPVGALTRE